ncbi:sugar ABC transporter substrate-binding protein [Arthrobacter bambusae]|uniref:sugar ABC transporter substrate-binding protein n=1 Tax=Arthrobacter bambusae TaxID=1338426 RepID=UPI0027800BE8|nr:sugar ABC transporter substrate-binding protein [Arthrobacter bambusae]MDQ0028498.1 ribose transport system substrate-binding protein [Arthrobacter bambusae]MDQ0096708.1 ribose transport system substrate-binding protein [Arthrobacter bambusae]
MVPTSTKRSASAWLAATAVASVAMFGLVACDSGGSSSGAAGGGTGSKEIIAFVPPSSDPYVANWLKKATDGAKNAGYTLKAVTEDSASAASAQVQQVLGGGNLPAMFVWWPVQPEAQVGSLAQLSGSGVPVFQVNQLPVQESEKYITAYAGVSDIEIGKIAGQAAIQARDSLKASGAAMTTPGGSVLVPNLPVGYGATRDRIAGFKSAIEGSGLTIVAEGNATGFSAQDAFTLTSQMIAANKSKGFDLVYAPEDDYAVGGIRALTQAGYKPGKNVEVIGGSCHGDDSTLKDKSQFNTIIQGAGLEGQFAMDRMLQYLKNPKVQDGQYVAPADADAVPKFPDTVSKVNIIPTPIVLAEKYPTAKLWGTPDTEWCTY